MTSSSSSNSYSYSKGSSSKSKGKGKETSDKKSSSSSYKTKALKHDPYAGSLSNRAGLDRFVHEPAYESAWNPVGAASSRK